MNLSPDEVLALRYHVRAEDYDRHLPGVWHPHPRDPECWLPRPDFVSHSNRNAAAIRRELRTFTLDPAGFARAITWASRYPYSVQRRMLEAAGYPGPEHPELSQAQAVPAGQRK
jgi:hypothetical protein